MSRADESKRVVVRQYSLLDPLNWGQDCADHLYLRNKFWNNLVEIERDHRTSFRTIVYSDISVANMSKKIQCIKDEIIDQDSLRKEARRRHRNKIGDHTKSFRLKVLLPKRRAQTLTSY